MKVLIYGRTITAECLRQNLVEHGVVAATAVSQPEMETMLASGLRPDIVIIDRWNLNAPAISYFCHDDLHICTVLLTGSSAKDWEALESYSVDGYISDRFNNGELKARLQAIFRRVKPACICEVI